MADEKKRISHVSEVKPNTIVQYKGGGYDGCIYEWNYAYFDAEGKFHSIFASGYKGCKNVEKLQEIFDYDESRYRQAMRDRAAGFSSRYDPELDLYELDNPEEIQRFGRQTPISHLIFVAKWFGDNHIPLTLTVKCDECGEIVPVIGCDGEGVHGIGGTQMEYNKIVCPECESRGRCAYCGDYVGEENLNPDSGYCTGVKHDEEWCHERHQ